MENIILSDKNSNLNEFSFLGTWWIPQDPNQKVSGTLTFSPDDGVKLTLYAPLESAVPGPPSPQRIRLGNREFGRIFGPPLIHGIRDDGCSCTVFGARMMVERSGSAGARRADYVGTSMVLGKLVAAPDAPFFDQITVGLTYLESWFGDDPFSMTCVPGNTLNATVKYTSPEIYMRDLPKYKLTISSVPTIEHGIEDQTIVLRHSNNIRLKNDLPWSAEQCFLLLSDMRTLLTILIGSPLYFDELIADGKPIDVVEGETVQPRVAFYLPQPNRRMKDSLFAEEMLFPFSKIKDRFGDVLAAWLDRAKSLRAVYDLLDSVFFGTRLSPQVGLLTLTQAFEIFHRDQIGGDYMPNIADYEKVRAVISQAIPPEPEVAADHREALKSRIKFGNSYSMRKRIDTALKSLGKDVVGAITRDPKKFGKRIADTRNYLTHRDDGSKGDVIPDHHLATAAEKFRYFFTILLMRTLGIPPSETVAAIMGRYKSAPVLEWNEL